MSRVGIEDVRVAGHAKAAGKPFTHLDGERLTASWQRQGVMRGCPSAAEDLTP
jgi:hypothetical protein